MLDKNPSLSNADATFGTMPALLFDVVRPAESYAQALALLQAQP